MRRRKSFFSLVNRLTLEEKLIGAASVVTIVACFLPWYGITSRIMDQWWNGFSNIGSVVGYVVFLLALASLYSIIAPLFSLPVPKVLNQKMSHLLLHGEAAFLLVLMSFIYARYTVFDAPGSSVRFGLYAALIASFAGAISGYTLWRKYILDLKKKGIREDFIQMPKVRNVFTEVEMEPEANEQDEIDEQESLMPDDNNVSEVEPVVAEEKVEEAEGVEDIDKEKTIEELTSSLPSEHRGLSEESSDEPEESEVKEEEKMKLNF
jgi:hypothetical protein